MGDPVQRIPDFGQLVAIVGEFTNSVDLIVSVYDRLGFFVPVRIVPECIDHSFLRGGFGDIVVVVVFISHLSLVAFQDLGQIAIGIILILGGLLLQVCDRDHIPVFVVCITAAEGLLVQSNTVKPYHIGVMVITDGDSDGAVIFFCHRSCSGILPAITARIEFGYRLPRVSLVVPECECQIKSTGRIGIHKVLFGNSIVCPRPAGEHIAITCRAAVVDRITQVLFSGRIAGNGENMAVQVGCSDAGVRYHPVGGGQSAAGPPGCTAKGKVAVFDQIIAAGGRKCLYLCAIYIEGAGFVRQEKCPHVQGAAGIICIGELLPLPSASTGNGTAIIINIVALGHFPLEHQSVLCIGLDISGECNCLTGGKGERRTIRSTPNTGGHHFQSTTAMISLF